MSTKYDSRIKSMVNYADIHSLGTIGNRMCELLESSHIENLAKDDSVVLLLQMNARFQDALVPLERLTLRQNVISAFLARYNRYKTLKKLFESFKDSSDVTEKMHGTNLTEIMLMYGVGLIHKKLADQQVMYKKMTETLLQPDYTAAITAIGCTMWVNDFDAKHKAYEDAYAVWTKFKATHEVPTHLRSMIIDAIKTCIDALKIKVKHDKDGAVTALYKEVVQIIKNVDTQRKQQNEDNPDLPEELTDGFAEDANHQIVPEHATE